MEDYWKKWLKVSVAANALIGVAFLVMMYVDMQAEADSGVQFWFDYYVMRHVTTFPLATLLLLFYTVLGVVLIMFGLAFFFEGMFMKAIFSFIAAVPSLFVCYYQITDHILMLYASFSDSL